MNTKNISLNSFEKLNKNRFQINIPKEEFNILNSDFEEIREYFDELNHDESHFINSNDICTPIGCIKEMVDTIPHSFWKKENLKILDSCCGNGNFHAYILKKTKLENLYFNEINSLRIANVKKIFGKDINLTKRDFLEFEDKEEYDLVVSNPPYAKFTNNKRTAKNHNMSRAFIEKAINITKKNGYILFIVPNNWMSYADRNKLPEILSKYQFLHLNINGAKKWFSKIGSSFTWFLLKKTPNKKDFTIENHYKIKDTQKATLGEGVKFIPLYYSKIVKSILEKTLNSNSIKYKIETSSNLHRFTKKDLFSNEKNEIFKHRVIHTPTQTFWSKKPHKFQKGWKVFISLSNQYKTFIDTCGMTQSIAFIKCDSYEEAKKIKSELDNEIYFFLNNITRYGNFNNIRVLQIFPVFQNFKLTQEEKDFIIKFNDSYYKKKSQKTIFEYNQ